jgi:hypothetical protein
MDARVGFAQRRDGPSPGHEPPEVMDLPWRLAWWPAPPPRILRGRIGLTEAGSGS